METCVYVYIYIYEIIWGEGRGKKYWGHYETMKVFVQSRATKTATRNSLIIYTDDSHWKGLFLWIPAKKIALKWNAGT